MNEVTIINTNSPEETIEAARKFAKKLKPGDFLAFYGDLGSGKTAFISGLAKELCPGARVSSPTYAIVNEYRGNPDIYHFDMYRITDDDSLYAVGFYDYFDRGGIIAAEWCENIPFALPERRYEISFKKLDEEKRTINITRVNF